MTKGEPLQVPPEIEFSDAQTILSYYVPPRKGSRSHPTRRATGLRLTQKNFLKDGVAGARRQQLAFDHLHSVDLP